MTEPQTPHMGDTMDLSTDVMVNVTRPPVVEANLTLTMTFNQARVLAALLGTIHGDPRTTARAATDAVYDGLLVAFKELLGEEYINTNLWVKEFKLTVEGDRIRFGGLNNG